MGEFVRELGESSMAEVEEDVVIPEKPAQVQDFLKGDYVIRERWRVIQKLGMGAFGEVYRAYDEEADREVAVKIEFGNALKRALRRESKVLRSVEDKHHFPELIDKGKILEYGTERIRFEYLVMELLYRNISDLRRKSPTEKFSMSTGLRVSIQALEAIKQLHRSGYIHRDIKPSNFAMGYVFENRLRTVILIDFGLCRKYLGRTGKVLRARKDVGFRGTVRYASPTTHKGRELGRRDDLVSLFYMIVEICTGRLPWADMKNPDEVLKEKENRTCVQQLCFTLPRQISRFHKLISQLNYGEEPKYEALRVLLQEALESVAGKMTDPFDWEVDYETAILEDMDI